MKKILSAITRGRRWLGGVPLIERAFAGFVLGSLCLVLAKFEPSTPLEFLQALWGAGSLAMGVLVIPALPATAGDDA